VYEKADGLTGNHRSAREQWFRASQAIPLNIAEGNGKTAEADRRRYFEIARGSVRECGAIQDVLVVGKALDEQESLVRKTELDRMAAMLSRLGGRGCCVAENSVPYGTNRRKTIPIPISISKRRIPNKAVEATEYRRFTADVLRLTGVDVHQCPHCAKGRLAYLGQLPPSQAGPV
jgi:four helix bundle protein